jgi:hypothetical protein
LGGEGKFNVHLTKRKICEIFSSKITPELVALDFVGIDRLKILVLLRRDQEMRYKAIPILIFLSIIPTFFSSAYAQPQIREKTPGFITSTLEGKRIALRDYWEQQEGLKARTPNILP